MLSFFTRCGALPSLEGTCTTLSAPFPGSVPMRPRGLIRSVWKAVSVTFTRRDQSSARSDGDTLSAPTRTMMLRNASAEPTTSRNVRLESRQVNTAAASQRAMSEVRVCVSTTPITTIVVQATQKSRSSRRSAQTSSTSTSGNPRTR